MSLKEYGKKRKLSATPEPGPGPKYADRGKYPVFVVHKHAARSLHYDLRLEVGGVLKSFAVPKGPSMDPSVKHLAIMVEDHPFDYKNFEGVIPKGNYGAGGVIIWDRGVYSSVDPGDKKEIEKHMAASLKKGDMKFTLAGEKLKGSFALVKTGWQKNSWLLIKEKDGYATDEDILKKNSSVASGKTLEEISGEDDVPGIKDAPKKSMPPYISPMLCSSAKKPFDNPGWIFEIKWDGYRAIASASKTSVSLYSRNRLDLEKKFPSIAESLKKLLPDALLDGEIVALNSAGVPDFQMLQDNKKSGRGQLVYYVFDILNYRGHDLTGLPLIKRKEILEKILPSSGSIRFSGHVSGEGISFFNAAKKKGLEGIVAKKSDSVYQAGVRSPHWLKIKNSATQDCVIAGFTAPRGARKYFGSLVLGFYEKGRLVYAGHSGGGFSAATLKKIYEKLKPLAVKKYPFTVMPPEEAQVTWVRPELVCEIGFTGWTKGNLLRHPVFLRLRDDKPAAEAVKEV
jgi:bifunctional non-homologous end joining protein LigD